MTAETDSHPPPEPFAAHESARRGGSIVMVLLVAAGIVAVAVALMTIGRAQAQPYILGLLALLAMVGLFNLFAFAAGIIRFTDRTADDPVMGRIADHSHDGLAVTDSKGHVVYSNAAYLALTGAATAQDVRPVERVFIGNPDVSEAVFRLLKAAREVIERVKHREGPVIVDQPSHAFGPAGSTVGARMQVADRLIGYLVVESATPGFFTADHADRLGAIADLAGAALSNSQLARRVSELAATEERQRLARDLHDAVNQTLWTAALTAESLLNDIDPDSELFHRADRLRQLNRGALAEMRSLLLELRPDELAEVDLAQLITHLLDALECRRTLDVTAALDPVRLEPDVHVAFYRIAQESLGNVAQHAELPVAWRSAWLPDRPWNCASPTTAPGSILTRCPAAISGSGS